MLRDLRSIAVGKMMGVVGKEIKCVHCDESLGYYYLADVVIVVHGFVWCGTACHDNWMDAIENKVILNK